MSEGRAHGFLRLRQRKRFEQALPGDADCLGEAGPLPFALPVRILGDFAEVGESSHRTPPLSSPHRFAGEEGEIEREVVDDDSLRVPSLPERGEARPVLQEIGRVAFFLAKVRDPLRCEPVDSLGPMVWTLLGVIETVEKVDDPPLRGEDDRRGGDGRRSLEAVRLQVEDGEDAVVSHEIPSLHTFRTPPGRLAFERSGDAAIMTEQLP